jgi:predicted Fe-Mo cluster-binding NifX family protein
VTLTSFAGDAAMMHAAQPLSDQTPRVALVVMRAGADTALCPFFGKCYGLLIIDPGTGAHEFQPNMERTAEAMCDQILGSGVTRLILGFIGGPAAGKLRAAGVDIRLGSCACAVDDLAARFDDLPAL